MAKKPKGCTCVGPIHMEELDIPTAESTHSWSDLRGRPMNCLTKNAKPAV